MSGWIIFWAIIILFSLISFTYMSIKILYKGLPELKSMFTNLDQRSHSSKTD
jgi:hypothetical protein